MSVDRAMFFLQVQDIGLQLIPILFHDAVNLRPQFIRAALYDDCQKYLAHHTHHIREYNLLRG